MSRLLICLAGLLIAPTFALGQGIAPPQPFSGTIVKVADDAVDLQDKDGKSVTVQMTPGWTVSVNRKGGPDDIKPGDFVATTNVPVSDDRGTSKEVRVLEPGYRPEEGTHAVSATDPNMMTHGTVKTATKTDAGLELEVTYPGGSRHIVVPAGASVTISDPLDRSVLKPGVAVAGVTRPGPDEVQRASRLQLSAR